MRKFWAVVVFAIAFGVTFFDNLYKLDELEWVPDALRVVLIVASIYIWQPAWLRRAQGKDAEPPVRDDDAA